jgi:hypothetical protein
MRDARCGPKQARMQDIPTKKKIATAIRQPMPIFFAVEFPLPVTPCD